MSPGSMTLTLIPLRGFLERERAREGDDAGLGRAVERHAERRLRDRRAVHAEVDDPPVARARASRATGERERDRRAEVAVDHRAIVVERAAREALDDDRPDGMDEHVDRTARGLDGAGRLTGGARTRDRSAGTAKAPRVVGAQGGQRRVGRRAARPVGERDAVTALGEPQRDPRAPSPAAAPVTRASARDAPPVCAATASR